jgi:hypothetical protein
MSTFNNVRVLNMSTERRHHTKYGLHLNKKGKDWVVNKLVKEIRNLYLLSKISPPIVLLWRDVNENVSQLAEPNKGLHLSRNDLKDDAGNQVLPVTINDDPECPSVGCRCDDCPKIGDSAVGVDSLSKIDVQCLGKTSKVNDDPQEDVTTCKSTRVEKLPTKKYQDFLC